MPLMKTTGNLTTEAIMLTVAGRLVGGMEKTLPRAAKQKAARMIARAKMNGLDIVTPRKRPSTTGTREIPNPKIKDAMISPRIIASVFNGQDISLSNVLACASQGITIGDIEVAVKKSIMPRSPGIMKSAVR